MQRSSVCSPTLQPEVDNALCSNGVNRPRSSVTTMTLAEQVPIGLTKAFVALFCWMSLKLLALGGACDHRIWPNIDNRAEGGLGSSGARSQGRRGRALVHRAG